MANHIANITYNDYHDFKPGFSLDLRRVNILVGENGVGKTLVLDSISIATGGASVSKMMTVTPCGDDSYRPLINTVFPVSMKKDGMCYYRGAIPHLDMDSKQALFDFVPYISASDLTAAHFDRRRYYDDSVTTKLINLYVALMEREFGDLLLIDELENGMHYKTIQSVAVNLQKLSKERDKQVIATVNSCECLRSLYNAFAVAGDLDNFQIVRLERNSRSDDKTILIVIADENLVTCMAAGYEIR